MALRFALDHNFPQPLVAKLGPYFPEADLVPIEQIDPGFATLDDWDVLLALHLLGGPAGLVTCDASMLDLPRAVAVLVQTKQALVVTEGVGHDPFRATGLLLTHLSSVCKRLKPGSGQVWRLSASEKRPDDPWKELTRLAGREKLSPPELYERERLSAVELLTNPLTRPR